MIRSGNQDRVDVLAFQQAAIVPVLIYLRAAPAQLRGSLLQLGLGYVAGGDENAVVMPAKKSRDHVAAGTAADETHPDPFVGAKNLPRHRGGSQRCFQKTPSIVHSTAPFMRPRERRQSRYTPDPPHCQ